MIYTKKMIEDKVAYIVTKYLPYLKNDGESDHLNLSYQPIYGGYVLEVTNNKHGGVSAFDLRERRNTKEMFVYLCGLEKGLSELNKFKEGYDI